MEIDNISSEYTKIIGTCDNPLKEILYKNIYIAIL